MDIKNSQAIIQNIALIHEYLSSQKTKARILKLLIKNTVKAQINYVQNKNSYGKKERDNIGQALQRNFGVNSVDEMFMHFFRAYTLLFTQNVNLPQNTVYNNSGPEALIQILQKVFPDGKPFNIRDGWTHAVGIDINPNYRISSLP